MWDCLVEKCNGGVKVDVTKSFYVGDAAGRAKDHSASDKQFAAKCNLKFYTEKEFFSWYISWSTSSAAIVIWSKLRLATIIARTMFTVYKKINKNI